MKAVLRSIKPYWLYLILIGQKTIEVGKTFPKAYDWNKEVFLHCSKDMKSFKRIPEKDREWMRKYLGRCACRFVCDDIDTIAVFNDLLYCVKNSQANKLSQMCLTIEEIKAYLGSKNQGYNWHISDLVIYDKPRELSGFFHCCGDNPKCNGCEAHYYSNTECGKEDYCCSPIEGCKPLKRPFQSWGYVEGV